MPQSEFAFDGQTQRRLQRVEQLLQELMSGRRLEDASIGARGLRLLQGGGLTIFGGSLRMTSEDGTTGLLYFGDSELGRRIWAFSYETGELALHLAGDTGQQHIAMRDRSGNIALSTDGESGAGLARPYLPYRLVPSSGAEQSGTRMWPSTAASSPVKIWQGVNPIEQPRLVIGVIRAGIGEGTTGHWRLDINNVTVLADETTSGGFTVDVPGWGSEIWPGRAVGIDIYAWVTGGEGRTWLQVDRIHGMQS